MPHPDTAPSPAKHIEHALTRSLGESRYERYFARDACLDVTGGRTVRVRVKDRFYADWLASRFGRDLESAAREATGVEAASIDWVVDPSAFDESPEHGAPGAPSNEGSPAESSSLGADTQATVSRPTRCGASARYRRPTWKNPPLKGRLDDFVVGACNRLAHNAATRVANDDHSVEFSMLFLHGECGVGKTHLLQGIVNAYRRNKPGAKALYVTGEAFTNRYISAVYKGRMNKFRDEFRDLDLLCIDDVHFISGKDGTQSECLNTLKDLDLSGARIVLASDEHPRRIAKLDHRLLSCLLSGMIVAMDRPDEATRRVMVRRIATSRGLALDPAALGALVERCEGSVRDIVGAITRIEALLKLMPEASGPEGSVTPALVHRALGEVNMSRPMRPIKVADIATTVCSELMVDLSEMLGRSRHRRVVLARQLTAHLARKLTTHSYPEIAQQMGRTNHSTIVTACKRVEGDIESGVSVEDPLTNELSPIDQLIERLRAAILRDSAHVSSA